MIKWSENPEYVDFMMGFIPGHSETEIREEFNKRFGIILSEGQIGNFKHNHNIKSGTVGGRFEKGRESHNKGKKVSKEMYEKMKPTMFKKGDIPKNHREVGSERINVDGYVEIKVAEPNKWVSKSRLVYEKAHNVKLTSNDAIIFLDGNKLNLEVSNLYKLTRAGLARYNQDHLYTNDQQISKAAAQIADIKDKLRKKRK